MHIKQQRNMAQQYFEMSLVSGLHLVDRKKSMNHNNMYKTTSCTLAKQPESSRSFWKSYIGGWSILCPLVHPQKLRPMLVTGFKQGNLLGTHTNGSNKGACGSRNGAFILVVALDLDSSISAEKNKRPISSKALTSEERTYNNTTFNWLILILPISIHCNCTVPFFGKADCKT